MSFGNIFSKFVTYLLTLLTLSFLEVFKFNEVLTLILSYIMPFTLHLKKSLLYTNLSNNFSPRRFIFILSSNTHFFELTFVKGVSYVSKLLFFVCKCPVGPVSFVKKTYLCSIVFPLFLCWIYLCGSISRFFILFHCYCLFFFTNYTL